MRSCGRVPRWSERGEGSSALVSTPDELLGGAGRPGLRRPCGTASLRPFYDPWVLFGCAMPLVRLRFPARTEPRPLQWQRGPEPPDRQGSPTIPEVSLCTSLGLFSWPGLFSLGEGPFLPSQDVVPGVFWIPKLKHGPGLFSVC